MDKSQATDYVKNRIRNGYDIDVIAADLSKELRVPLKLITKFVKNVFDSNSQNQSSGDKPSTMEDKKEKEPRKGIKDISESNEIVSRKISPDSVRQKSGVGKNIGKIKPSEVTRENGYYPGQETKESNAYNLEEIRLFVIKSLINHHRHNDIVAAVCTRTGMNWNAAQRFVATTQTQSHEELSRNNTSFMLLFSVLFIIGGILLLGWSVISMINYYNSLTGLEPEVLPPEFLVWIFTGFITSLGIISGGIFGFYRSLSNQ